MLQTKQEILYWIFRNLDGKPYAITDSEVAADSLHETLYNLGFVEKNDDNPYGDYYRMQSLDKDDFWEMKFVAM